MGRPLQPMTESLFLHEKWTEHRVNEGPGLCPESQSGRVGDTPDMTSELQADAHLDNGAARGDARDARREEDEEGRHDAGHRPPDEHQNDEPNLRADSTGRAHNT